MTTSKISHAKSDLTVKCREEDEAFLENLKIRKIDFFVCLEMIFLHYLTHFRLPRLLTDRMVTS